MLKIFYYIPVCSLIFLPMSAQAAYVVKGGKLVPKEEAPTMTVQEHFSAAINAYQKENWIELVHHAKVIVKNFEGSPFVHESLFYQGVGYFHLNDYQLANESLSEYLKKQATPKHFEEAIQVKFAIAEKFQGGAKKHVLGKESLPQWIPARDDALAIYEEVISALPHHELGAEALYGKAKLLFKDEDFKASIEAFQTLIRRFPKHPLSIEGYVGIEQVYLTQCKAQYPDPDFLDLALITLRKFREDFPGESEKIAAAESIVQEMQETYAASLYETAQFFERTKKPNASVIYYSKILSKYPTTSFASLSTERLHVLKLDQPSQMIAQGDKKSQSLVADKPSLPGQPPFPTEPSPPEPIEEGEAKPAPTALVDPIVNLEENEIADEAPLERGVVEEEQIEEQEAEEQFEEAAPTDSDETSPPPAPKPTPNY